MFLILPCTGLPIDADDYSSKWDVSIFKSSYGLEKFVVTV